MRAKVYRHRGTLKWVVDLWAGADIRGVPFFFGERTFSSHAEALGWATRRVDRGRVPHA